MKIKLTKVNFKGFKIGDIITVSKKEADYLVKSKVAEIIPEKPKKKPKKEVK